jgi:hypothetical protein
MVSMEAYVLRRSLPELRFRFDLYLTNLLSHTTRKAKMPNLRCVYNMRREAGGPVPASRAVDRNEGTWHKRSDLH